MSCILGGSLLYGNCCLQVQTVQVVRTSSVKKCTFYGQGSPNGDIHVSSFGFGTDHFDPCHVQGHRCSPNGNFGEAGLPCCLPTGNLFGLCVGPMQDARSPDGRSWRSGQFGRSFCSQGSVMKDISEGFRGKPLICSLLGTLLRLHPSYQSRLRQLPP